ncbi:MAG: imidazole glycerol phosphate synthase subunit HisH [Anaerolineae bacterium]|jgi:glutamine amidotransferase
MKRQQSQGGPAVVIVDYGVGNLRSVQKALERVGAGATIQSDPAALDPAQGVVLPGVGAFGDGMAQLRARGLVEPLLRQVGQGKPLLGICLGMQLLFEESEEMGRHPGLGLLPGRVVRFPENDLKVPHVGWNRLRFAGHPLLAGIPPGAYAYFVHSYYARPQAPGDVLATTDYGLAFASVVGRGRVWGAQFHPEKSQEVGLRLLANFCRLVGGEEVGT